MTARPLNEVLGPMESIGSRNMNERAPAKPRQLSDTEQWAIANALRTAAEQYKKDADIFTKLRDAYVKDDPRWTGHDRSVRGFSDQATVALSLADAVEGAASMTITG